MELRPFIGILFNLEVWFFFVLNIVCLFCIYRSRLYKNSDNPAYLITTFNLLSETFQLLIHVIYIGPIILFGEWFFDGQASLGVTIVSVYFLGLWYLGSFIQILMASNRLCVVFFPGRTIMTHGRLYVVMFLMVLFASVCVTYSQLLSPCCRITPDFRDYSYSYLVFANQTENPSMRYVDVPVDFSTSLICVISYISLFAYVYHMSSSESGIKKREIRLTVQFLIMFLCYTIAWVTFFTFPLFGIQAPEAYVITSAMLVANCGVNAVVYLTMNKEVRLEMQKALGKVAPSLVYHSTSNHPVTRNTNQDFSEAA